MKRDQNAKKQNDRRMRAFRNKKRLRLVPIVILLLVSIMGTTIPQHQTNSYQVQEEYLVQPGDTLWSIASSYAKQGDDVRLMVDRMVEANRLSDDHVLRPGDKIIVVLEERNLSL